MRGWLLWSFFRTWVQPRIILLINSMFWECLIRNKRLSSIRTTRSQHSIGQVQYERIWCQIWGMSVYPCGPSILFRTLAYYSWIRSSHRPQQKSILAKVFICIHMKLLKLFLRTLTFQLLFDFNYLSKARRERTAHRSWYKWCCSLCSYGQEYYMHHLLAYSIIFWDFSRRT